MTEKIIEHTPGPYEVDSSTYIYADNGEGKQVVVGMAYSHDKEAGMKAGWPIARANAFLFAAAPDLLAAAYRLKEFISEGSPIHPVAWKDMESAIAKAKGYIK